MKVSIVCTEAIKPSLPTPPEKRDFNLSFIDERIPHFYIALILYYYPDKIQTKQPEILRCLKSSLSNTLTHFYPLAGRIKGQTIVDCNDQGAYYVEARVETTSSLREIIESPEAHDLEQLVPFKKADGRILATSEELLGVQVSSFPCGGVSIGISVSHRIADGSAICAFVSAWAAAARRGSFETVIRPVFNSARLFPPRGTPDFKPNENGPAVRPAPEPLVTKRYVFSASAINEMKARARATRVEVVSAMMWKSYLATKLDDKNCAATNSITFFPVNLRRRAAALPEYSFGNLYQMASAAANVGEDWPCLAMKIKSATEKINGGYITELQGEDGHKLVKENFGQIGKFFARLDFLVFRFSSWCGFPVYEIDFGWGKPGWVSIPSFGCIDFVTLLDSSCPGGVEAWVTMVKDDIIRLEQNMELQAFAT